MPETKSVEADEVKEKKTVNVKVNIFESCVNTMTELTASDPLLFSKYLDIARFMDGHFPECLSWDSIDVCAESDNRFDYVLMEKFLKLPIVATSKRDNLLQQLHKQSSRLILKPNKTKQDTDTLRVMTDTIQKITDTSDLTNFQPIVIYQTINDNKLEEEFRKKHSDDYDEDGNYVKELIIEEVK